MKENEYSLQNKQMRIVMVISLRIILGYLTLPPLRFCRESDVKRCFCDPWTCFS